MKCNGYLLSIVYNPMFSLARGVISPVAVARRGALVIDEKSLVALKEGPPVDEDDFLSAPPPVF